MRPALFLAAALLAQPAAAQWLPGQGPLAAPGPAWNPAADYVEVGQDEPGYRLWLASAGWRMAGVASFHRYLEQGGVSFVAPTWQLLRTASHWRRCNAAPFEIPPVAEWANIVQTLRYVRDHVVPVIGPVEPVSVFRNAHLNACAGGAAESVHKSMSAIDFVPRLPIARDVMISRLCAEHQREGPRFNAGLGFYTRMRFHVDSWRYRTWGRNDRGAVACPKVAPPVLPVAADTTTAAAPTAVPPAGPAVPPATATTPAPLADPLAPR